MSFDRPFMSKTTALVVLTSAILAMWIPNLAQASCGSASCFLNIGNQPAVQPKGTLRADFNYSYVPQTGPQQRVAAVNLKTKEQILDEHKEISTITNQFQLNLNYGVTDNFTLQLTVPVLWREHEHRVEVGIDPDSGHHEGEGVLKTGTHPASGISD